MGGDKGSVSIARSFVQSSQGQEIKELELIFTVLRDNKAWDVQKKRQAFRFARLLIYTAAGE